jgi:hypothetical protein
VPAELTRIASVLRITPVDGTPWDVAIGTPGWARTPNPDAIAVLSDNDAFVLDVAERHVLLREPGIVRITEDERHDIVLLIGWTYITAIGRDGIVWSTERLALDDLKVVATLDDRIVCTGSIGELLPVEITVDPVTGAKISGPALLF